MRVVGKESFDTVRDGNGELLAILGRELISGEHVAYFTSKGNSEDIAEKLIRND